ncbi:hypothetical protein R3131_005055 [Salmonella enterica]|nr:hypothetical protein [Salmonella enterica]
MKKNYLLLLTLSASFLAGCSTQQKHLSPAKVERVPVLMEKRVAISSEGDFSGKPLTGAQFNRIIAKKIDEGSWKGYVVHTVTAAPWNNTWSSKGLSVPTNITYAGTYQNRNFYENSGNDKGITSRDMSGWYGFHVNMAETTKHSNYTGVNAFGVKANVEVLNTRGASIVFGSTQINEGSSNPVWPDIDVIGGVPKDINLKDLKIEYLARITGMHRSFIEGNSPTLSDPSDTNHQTQIFTGDLLAARLINAKTGAVYPVKLEWVFRTRGAFP